MNQKSKRERCVELRHLRQLTFSVPPLYSLQYPLRTDNKYVILQKREGRSFSSAGRSLIADSMVKAHRGDMCTTCSFIIGFILNTVRAPNQKQPLKPKLLMDTNLLIIQWKSGNLFCISVYISYLRFISLRISYLCRTSDTLSLWPVHIHLVTPSEHGSDCILVHCFRSTLITTVIVPRFCSINLHFVVSIALRSSSFSTYDSVHTGLLRFSSISFEYMHFKKRGIKTKLAHISTSTDRSKKRTVAFVTS